MRWSVTFLNNSEKNPEEFTPMGHILFDTEKLPSRSICHSFFQYRFVITLSIEHHFKASRIAPSA
jgi:hypothetical protein